MASPSPVRRALRAVGGVVAVLSLVAGVWLALRSAGPKESGEKPAAGPAPFGVLVMAHGGTPAWNEAVLAAAREAGTAGASAPAIDEPVEVAFGMADAVSIQEAVARLEARGVRRVGVVRLFVSGESWRERTKEILGIAPGAPERSAAVAHGHAGAEPGGAAGTKPSAAAPADPAHRMEYWRVEAKAAFAVSPDGLVDDDATGTVLADRAAALSRAPEREDVLVLAHGPGDDAENARWLARMDRLLDAVRAARPFRRVAAMTLREDWPEKRAAAEREVRAYVARAGEEGGRALVVPLRVHGFGPYARVLEGLSYDADKTGLLPHPAVAEWIRARAAALRDGAFERPAPRAAPGAAARPTVPLGTIAPDVSLRDADGAERRLADLCGPSATVLYFWCVDCPCVPAVEDRVKRAMARFPDASGVRFVGIDAHREDKAPAVRDAMKKVDARYPMLLDPGGRVAGALGVSKAVTFVVLDGERRMRYRGALDDDLDAPTREYLGPAIEAVLRGAEPRPAETDGEGCPYP